MCNLYRAYLIRYVNDPKLANGEITGAYCWPPEDDPADLMRQADNLIDEMDGLCSVFPHVDKTRDTIVRAARDALQIVLVEERLAVGRAA